MPAERFLDRFTLPRVVRTTTVTAAAAASSAAVSATSGDDTIQSSSSHGSSTAATAAATVPAPDKGELCMLYKQVKNRKIYHGFNAKSGASRKKGVMVPQEFQGECRWEFALVADEIYTKLQFTG